MICFIDLLTHVQTTWMAFHQTQLSQLTSIPLGGYCGHQHDAAKHARVTRVRTESKCHKRNHFVTVAALETLTGG